MYFSMLGVNSSSSLDDIKQAFRVKTLDDNDDYESIAHAYNEILDNKKKANDVPQMHQVQHPVMSNIFQPAMMIPGLNKVPPSNMIPNDLFGLFGLDVPAPTQEESNRFKKIFQNVFVNDDKPKDFESTIHNLFDEILNETKPKEDVIIHTKDIDIRDVYQNAYLGDVLNEDDLRHISCADVRLDSEQIFSVTSGNKKRIYKITLSLTNTGSFSICNGYLCYTIDITLEEALCGFSHDFKHLNGKEYKLTNSKTVINNKSEIKLNNLGIKRKGVDDTLLIRFNIEFPETLNEKQKQEIKSILN